MLVLADTYYPGWHAYIDGERVPIYKVNYCLKGAMVPAGTHQVFFRFEPESIRAGLITSGVSFSLICLSLAWLGLHRPRNSWAPTTDAASFS